MNLTAVTVDHQIIYALCFYLHRVPMVTEISTTTLKRNTGMIVLKVKSLESDYLGRGENRLGRTPVTLWRLVSA